MRTVTKISIVALCVTLFGVIILGTDAAGNLRAQTEEPEPSSPPIEEIHPDAEEGAEHATILSSNAVVIEQIGERAFHLVPQSAIEAGLATAVSDGVLTQAEADKIVTDIQANVEAEFTVIEEAIPVMPFLEEHQLNEAVEGFTYELLPGADFGLHDIGGFPGALHKVVDAGVLTETDVQAILTDFAEIAGDNVAIQLPDANDENMFFYSMGGNMEDLRAAQEEALANAVANGRLSQVEADEILANSAMPMGEIITGLPTHIEMFGEDAILEEFIITEGNHFFLEDGNLTEFIDEMLADESIADEDIQALIDTLQNKLDE